VADTVAPRLPRGRHGLSRDEVERDQRVRILMGMAEAMRAKGYVGTPVAEVIKRAGVSRETFYQLYAGKLECFLAAFDLVGDLLVGHLAASLEGAGTPLDRFERALTAYLETMAAEPAYARLFLVEVYAAGPEAMARRAALQQRIVDALVELFGVGDERRRFSCQVLVAAISSMVTGPLVTDDLDAIPALGPRIVEQARALL
jgi:AcrR family transcriptional regulator